MKGTRLASVQEGDTIAGKYRVERVLGKGGMGLVVAATHLQLGERVAIKLLRPHALEQEEIVTRFLREGSTLARLRSEHVARIHDVGTLDTGSPYIVMEYLDGRDLGAVIREEGPLEVEAAVEYILQACEALAEAHAMGVVHRDLKPENLVLIRRRDGTAAIKIIDFGISKLLPASDGDIGITQSAVPMGSPRYMAPEQMTSARDVDARADVWALGAILHYLLIGSPPFDGASMVEIFMMFAGGPRPLRDLRPDVPEGLEAPVFRCLRRDRSERFGDVAELAAALLPFGPPLSHVYAERAARILSAPQDSVRGRGLSAGLDAPRSARVPGRSDMPPASAPRSHKTPLVWESRQRELTTLHAVPSPKASAEHASIPADPGDRARDQAPAPPRSDPSVRERGPGASSGAADRDESGVEEAVREAVAQLGIEGAVVLEGTTLELRGAQKTSALDVAQLAEQWSSLPRDEQRRRAITAASRLAVAHRAGAAETPERGDPKVRRALPLLVGLAAVAAVGLGLPALLWRGGSEPEAQTALGAPALQRQRFDETCRASRQRIYSGTAIGPFDTVGWEVDLWLARSTKRIQDDLPASADAAAAGTTGRGANTRAAPLTATALGALGAGGRLAPALDRALSRVDNGTIAVRQSDPARSPDWSAVTVTFGDAYGRAFFDADLQPRFIAVAEQLYASTGADVGALYARCAGVDVHDVGAWFRGGDVQGAAAALLHQVAMFAEQPQITPAALSRLGAPGEVEGLRAAMSAAGLDGGALQQLLEQLGGSVAASPSGVAVTFPAKAPLRAVLVSRGLSDRMGLGR